MAGVPGDLARFCDHEYPRLVGTLTLYCGDRDVARDLAQEAMLRLVQAWPRVGCYARPGAWLHRVAMNLANSHFRRRRAEWRANRRSAGRGSTVVDDGADTTETGAVMREAVRRLPRRQREVLILRYFLDLPTDVVAEELGITVGSVRVLTHRAVKTLRSRISLAEDPDEEERYVG
jgi:RNA polymerase sigma-70 factor (sigma-E family)